LIFLFKPYQNYLLNDKHFPAVWRFCEVVRTGYPLFESEAGVANRQEGTECIQCHVRQG
jgi:hypothetical protein